MRTQKPNLAFDPWVQQICTQTMEALAFDLDAEAALLRIQAELELISDAIRSDAYALSPPPAPPSSPEHPLVRPYAMPGDFSQAPTYLPVEALIRAATTPADVDRAEWRRVLALCRRTRSLAEIAARGRLPLSATRTVVGEMFAAGLLTVQLPLPLGDESGREIIERVLLGLRAL